MLFSKNLILLTGCFLLFSCAEIQYPPNISYQSDRGKKVVAENGVVSSAHPLASEAGLEMLKKGGNAVDAAVAAAFVLNVVEPNMSGIGGGGSMLIWNQENSEADYVDFYSAKRAETYRNPGTGSLDNSEFDLLSVGIPGTVEGLLQALERHGNLSRQEVMAPAIRYADEGFPVYLTLAQFINDNEEKLTRYEGAANIYWPDGEPLQTGERLVQPEMAATLAKISEGGSDAFYTGEIAENMVQLMNEGGNPVTLADFAEYEPQWNKTPLCGTYKNYQVLSAPLPQTGIYIIHALNLLEPYDLKSEGLPTVSSASFDILTSVLRLSNADRARYVTDPNWEDIPVNGIISKAYADSRRELVGTGSVQDEIPFGIPDNSVQAEPAPGCEMFLHEAAYEHGLSAELSSPYLASSSANSKAEYEYADEAAGTGETTHISVVDGEGNAVSLSTTLSPVFGSGAWVDGFILNTSGYNFNNMNSEEEWSGGSHPYRIRSSTISPTIILEDGEVRLVIGAPGGGRIPTAVLQNIVYILEYDLDPLDAVKMPRIFPDSRNPEVQIERGFTGNTLQEAREMGYDIQSLSSGYARLYLIAGKDGKWIGVSDPRHDGEPRGY